MLLIALFGISLIGCGEEPESPIAEETAPKAVLFYTTR